MFDTSKTQFSVPEIPANLAQELGQYCRDVQEVVQFRDGLEWRGLQWTDPVFGAMGVKQNQVGRFLWVERSLPKFLHGDNCRLLSEAESVEAMEQLAHGVTGTYAATFGTSADLMMETAKVARLDVCYQQQVPCAQEVFVNVAQCLKAVKVSRHRLQLAPVVLHLTGVTFKQSLKELARWYDKGLESGNESYHDVVRQEEQLRAQKARQVAGWQGGRFKVNRAEALRVMNRRYDGWGRIESYDLAAVMREHGTKGAAAALLIVNPDYEPVFKAGLGESTYYRIKRIAEDGRKAMHSVDLRVPDDAWRESMVL